VEMRMNVAHLHRVQHADELGVINVLVTTRVVFNLLQVTTNS